MAPRNSSAAKKIVLGSTFLSLTLVNGFQIAPTRLNFSPIQDHFDRVAALGFTRSQIRFVQSTAIPLSAENEVNSFLPEIAGSQAAENSEAKMPLEAVEIGKEYKGIVKNIANFGAFIDIGAAVNGLVHVSQIADTYVRQASEVVSVGQEVLVKVLDVKLSEQKLILSMRKNKRNASQQRGDVSKFREYDPEAMITGKVEDILPYGAFVRLDEDIVGFVHISELRNERVEDVTEVINKGEEVQVRIINVDVEKSRISLSLRPFEEGSKTTSQKDVSVLSKYNDTTFVKGTVKSVKEYGVFVEVDGIQGLVHVSKIRDSRVEFEDLQEMFKVGEEIEVRVIEVDTVKNKAYFSSQATAAYFAEFDPEKIITATVTSIADSFVIALLEKGYEALLHRKELPFQVQDLKERFKIGDKLDVRIISVDPENNQVRLSMREFSRGKPQGKDVSQFANFNSAEFIPGKVVKLTSYGAFVNVADNVDGMVHISQISPDKNVERVEDELSVGQDVQVRIVSCDVASGKLELSMVPPKASPRKNADVSAFAEIPTTQFIPGKVSGITNAGAFVSIGEGVDGFLHIGQIQEERTENVTDVLQVGQDVDVRIVEVDRRSNKVKLSMRQPREPREKRKTSEFENFDQSEGVDPSKVEADWQKFLTTDNDSFSSSIN